MTQAFSIVGAKTTCVDSRDADVFHTRGPVIVENAVADARCLDATGLVVLPGIVDIHGDAFERQIMPRPGVHFDLDMALLETDRQLAANGITTACHAVTCSWEPGLRTLANGRSLIEAVERLRDRLAVDTIVHLRHETFNLDAEPEIADWIGARRIGVLAFNDHMAGTIKDRERPAKIATMIERAGVPAAEFHAVVDRVWARRAEVPQSIARLAAQCRAAGIPAMSHDDTSPELRRWYRDMGCTIAEFPVNEETAAAAFEAGDFIVFGAPNVIRGGSHTGCPAAAKMVARGHCSILASDYYYPALATAPFRLAAEGACSLASAWSLISLQPARALGLTDRGQLAVGQRADIVLADPVARRIIATVAAGRLAYCSEVERLR